MLRDLSNNEVARTRINIPPNDELISLRALTFILRLICI